VRYYWYIYKFNQIHVSWCFHLCDKTVPYNLGSSLILTVWDFLFHITMVERPRWLQPQGWCFNLHRDVHPDAFRTSDSSDSPGPETLSRKRLVVRCVWDKSQIHSFVESLSLSKMAIHGHRGILGVGVYHQYFTCHPQPLWLVAGAAATRMPSSLKRYRIWGLGDHGFSSS